MNRLARYGFILACTVAAVSIVAGCSSDKGTGPPTLSKETQLDSLSTYISLEPTGHGNDIVSVMLGQLNPVFWDGVDESDFISTGSFLAKRLPISVSPAAVTDTTVSFSYDTSGGWWYIEYRASYSSVFPPVTYNEIDKDSVRFETETGTAQQVPDEVSTYRIIQHSSITVIAESTAQDDSVGVQLISNTDVAGLNSPNVTVNGDGLVAIGVIAVSDQGSLDFSFDMLTNWEDVALSNPGTEQACPTSGNITGDFTLDMAIQNITNHYQASGNWNVGILFSGSGNTTVSVQSGDFQKSYTGNVCSK